MIRTDSSTQSIVKFLIEPNASTQLSHTLPNSSPNVSQVLQTSFNKPSSKIIQKTQLTSIDELLKIVDQNSDEDLKNQIRKLKFVGNVDRGKSLIQCENILYICDSRKLAREVFYQQSLKRFENFDSIEFEEPLQISKLARIGFDLKECEWTEEDGSKDELAKQVEKLLMEQRDMLKEYFQISININGQLEGLPIIVDDYSPPIAHLPMFIIRLATEVNYNDEKECFETIAKELSTFYSRWSLTSNDKEFNYIMEHIIFPEIRKSLNPPKEFATDTTFLKLTSLQELYKVFERC